MEKEKSKSMTIVVIILTIMVLGLGGYIAYNEFVKVPDKNSAKEVKKESDENKNNIPKEEYKETAITKEMTELVETYLSSLRFNLNAKIDVDDISWNEKIQIAYFTLPDSKKTKYNEDHYCSDAAVLKEKFKPNDLRDAYIKLFGENGYKDDSFEAGINEIKYIKDKQIYEMHTSGVCGDEWSPGDHQDNVKISSQSQSDNKVKVVLDSYYYIAEIEEGNDDDSKEEYHISFYYDSTYNSYYETFDLKSLDWDEIKKLEAKIKPGSQHEFTFIKSGDNLILESIEKIK